MRFRNLKKQSKKQNKTSLYKETRLYPAYSERIKALITDMFMIYIPILYIMAYIVLGGKEDFQASSEAQFIAVALNTIIYALFISISGQTPGKKAYAMQVVDAKTEQKLSFLRALWRYVAFLFTATTLVGLFLPLYRKDKKALHDIMSASMNISIDTK